MQRGGAGMVWALLAACAPGPSGDPKSDGVDDTDETDVVGDTDDSDTVPVDHTDPDTDDTADTDDTDAMPLGTFVEVGPIAFRMGCTPDQYGCDDNERPPHDVSLTRTVLVAAHEVTQGEFAVVLGYRPSSFVDCGDDCPVESVTWHEATAYAVALSTAAGLTPCATCTGSGADVRCTAVADPYACPGYRLPTEAEWEAAARCRGTTVYAGSNNPDEVAWYGKNSGIATKPVGRKKPNNCGLYDLSGNVFEWTLDWQGPYGAAAVVDPVGPSAGTERVGRGGAYDCSELLTRVSSRGGLDPASRDAVLGFRVVRTKP
ncbi:MAG: formylglycine-generating enzyme family protein [Alphaproteobacteria bacterium]|nr:formylglycine-generating enzyme family protein [Alphaproteobacteria bacterium]